MSIIRGEVDHTTPLSTLTLVFLTTFIVWQLAIGIAIASMWYQAAEPCVDYEDYPESHNPY